MIDFFETLGILFLTKFQAFWVFRQSKIAQTAQMCNFLKTANLVSIRVCAGCARCARFFSRAYARFLFMFFGIYKNFLYARVTLPCTSCTTCTKPLSILAFSKIKIAHLCRLCRFVQFYFFVGAKGCFCYNLFKNKALHDRAIRF